MNALEEALGRLSRTQGDRLRALWVQLERGLVTRDEFVKVAVNVILAGNARAYALGAQTVRSLVEQALRLPEVTVAAPNARHLDAARVSKALATILASDVDTVMQLVRLADNEPKQAAADGSGDVIRSSKRVKGWVRSLDSDACELCRWWWREGRVWQKTHPMPRHTGCTCTQTPVVTRTTNYQTAKQEVAAAREARRRERSTR